MLTFTAMNFPLNTALVASHKFWYIVFLFSLISKYFLISLWLLLWAIGCLYMRCLLSKYLLIFHFSFCYQFLASVHCGQRKYSDDFNLLKFIQICFVALLNVVILEGVPSTLEKNVYSVVGCSSLVMSIISTLLTVVLSQLCPYWLSVFWICLFLPSWCWHLQLW